MFIRAHPWLNKTPKLPYIQSLPDATLLNQTKRPEMAARSHKKRKTNPSFLRLLRLFAANL